MHWWRISSPAHNLLEWFCLGLGKNPWNPSNTKLMLVLALSHDPCSDCNVKLAGKQSCISPAKGSCVSTWLWNLFLGKQRQFMNLQGSAAILMHLNAPSSGNLRIRWNKCQVYVSSNSEPAHIPHLKALYGTAVAEGAEGAPPLASGFFSKGLSSPARPWCHVLDMSCLPSSRRPPQPRYEEEHNWIFYQVAFNVLSLRR